MTKHITTLSNDLLNKSNEHFVKLRERIDKEKDKEYLYLKEFDSDIDELLVSFGKDINIIVHKFNSIYNPGRELRDKAAKACQDSIDNFKKDLNSQRNTVLTLFEERGKLKY